MPLCPRCNDIINMTIVVRNIKYKCPICLDDFQGNGVSIQCGDVFCECCLDTYLKYKRAEMKSPIFRFFEYNIRYEKLTFVGINQKIERCYKIILKLRKIIDTILDREQKLSYFDLYANCPEHENGSYISLRILESIYSSIKKDKNDKSDDDNEILMRIIILYHQVYEKCCTYEVRLDSLISLGTHGDTRYAITNKVTSVSLRDKSHSSTFKYVTQLLHDD